MSPPAAAVGAPAPEDSTPAASQEQTPAASQEQTPAASQDQTTPGSSQGSGAGTPKKRLHSFFRPRGTPTKKSPRSALSPTAVTALRAGAASASASAEAGVAERIERNRQLARAKLLARRAERGDGGFAEGLEPTWRAALRKTLNEPFVAELHKFVTAERQRATVFPPPAAVFSAFNHSAFARTKVVIVGQDPYHGPGQAHGMSFSVAAGVSHPPSLRNIFAELESDIPGFCTPRSGCLEQWAAQGVLLLNAVLTVRRGEPASHQKRGWERFTDAVVNALDARPGKGIVFMLWGGYAKRKGARINTKRHCVLQCVHPSPLSAPRGWFGSKQFSKANAFLRKTGQRPIDWKL